MTHKGTAEVVVFGAKATWDGKEWECPGNPFAQEMLREAGKRFDTHHNAVDVFVRQCLERFGDNAEIVVIEDIPTSPLPEGAID